MYAMNMFYCHWLVKRTLLASGLKERSQVEIYIYIRERESMQSQKRNHVAATGKRCQIRTLPVGYNNVAMHIAIEIDSSKI